MHKQKTKRKSLGTDPLSENIFGEDVSDKNTCGSKTAVKKNDRENAKAGFGESRRKTEKSGKLSNPPSEITDNVIVDSYFCNYNDVIIKGED